MDKGADKTAFEPKMFYRKFDSLLTQIRGGGAKHPIQQALDEIVVTFGSFLHVESGSLYRFKGGVFTRIHGPVPNAKEIWPQSFRRDLEYVQLLIHHRSYIFADSEEPPWGRNSVAVVLGEEDQYIMAFRLTMGWEREALEFSLNTLRSTLNYTRTALRIRATLAEAQEIQKSLLPRRDPVFPGYDIAGRSIPAEEVGGDFYDYHHFSDQYLGLAIGDASGHGLPAALLARDVMIGLRMGVEQELKISGVIQKLNRVINQTALSTRFISLVYGELDRNGTFVYLNAGHQRPILIKKKSILELDVGGTILGPLPDAVFKRGFAFMDPGDTLFMYTDGLLERENLKGDELGKDRLRDFIYMNGHESAAAIVEKLFAYVWEFGGGENWRDDATVIIVKRLE